MYLSEIQNVLGVYPDVEVSAVEGYDKELDKATLNYVIDVNGVTLSYLTYPDDAPMSEGELEDFLEDIEARVNQIA